MGNLRDVIATSILAANLALPISSVDGVTLHNFRDPVGYETGPYASFTRLEAVSMIERGVQYLYAKQYYDALISMERGVAILERIKHESGDFDYARATLTLGALYYEMAKLHQADNPVQRNFLKQAIAKLKISSGEFKTRHDNSYHQQIMQERVVYFTNLYSLLTNAYFAIGDSRNALFAGIELLRFQPTSAVKELVVSLASECSKDDFARAKEMLRTLEGQSGGMVSEITQRRNNAIQE